MFSGKFLLATQLEGFDCISEFCECDLWCFYEIPFNFLRPFSLYLQKPFCQCSNQLVIIHAGLLNYYHSFKICLTILHYGKSFLLGILQNIKQNTRKILLPFLYTKYMPCQSAQGLHQVLHATLRITVQKWLGPVYEI